MSKLNIDMQELNPHMKQKMRHLFRRKETAAIKNKRMRNARGKYWERYHVITERKIGAYEYNEVPETRVPIYDEWFERKVKTDSDGNEIYSYAKLCCKQIGERIIPAHIIRRRVYCSEIVPVSKPYLKEWHGLHPKSYRKDGWRKIRTIKK